MDLLKEFFDPIPLTAMALAVFAVIFIWAISKCFRLPANFAENEEERERIRLRLFDQRLSEAMEAENAKAADDESEAAESSGEGTDGVAAATATAATQAENKR